MARASTQTIQTPGATAPAAGAEDAPVTDKGTDKGDPGVNPEAEIARLKAELAAAKSQIPGAESPVITTPVTEHGRQVLAASQHKHLTSAELDAKVRSGEVKLIERHVLCADGWYVNPTYVQG